MTERMPNSVELPGKLRTFTKEGSDNLKSKDVPAEGALDTASKLRSALLESSFPLVSALSSGVQPHLLERH